MAEAKERVRVPATMQTMQQQLPAQESETGRSLRVLAEAAANPYVDAEKMKVLHQVMKDVYEFEGKKAFTRAFNALQGELPAITRDGKIDHGGGAEHTRSGKKALKAGYATYPNIMRVINPLLKRHGFTLSNVVEPTPSGDRIHVVGYLEHIDGHQRVSRFPMSIDTTGSKNNQQGWGSSQQYGMRYNAIALLNIVSEAPQDQDNDGYAKKSGGDFPADQVETISADQHLKLRDAIEACGVPIATVFKKYGIEKLTDLPIAQFDHAIAACKEYAERARG
jgi:hypothetical protein